ncbi:MAG: anhydro-N-acetylmuramic acid kinase [Gammaproteobacteria bacterium]|nr:anhydro-N-acetylmuramic acid kinase [Gammaproteobacteria bacterium]MBT8094500.1 anhydro-N-acetylmuramic acid kinase [Gammaproteobacteria bacterium]MBT8105045.1 anhydro-N-acetylmuramic acid kinase [Gammaproteobacteria bacterium]NNK25059.1 anhydro-N-acetylmuramic acid kinase [Woeseiaceae bacterium]NNL64067.1 anhydro-N-acetylmuramic acid kinase [Woeseiaceae bacterium]
MPGYYIGLMSGTSMDGIDAALVAFGRRQVHVVATHQRPYAETLRHALRKAVATPVDQPIDNIGALDRQVGECFRDAVAELLSLGGVAAQDVVAIGSHGQTVRHQPDGLRPYTLQIGNPDLIARGTGITTVADFRSADIVAGGQGAPLVPPFHDWLFGRGESGRVILNIGGIANITILGSGDAPVRGFDTGPGNTLLDQWSLRHRGEPFDRDGAWAATGTSDAKLLARLLAYEYFRLDPPKSTGVEEFNLAWLAHFDVESLPPADVQATLAELSAQTIVGDVARHAPGTRELLVCGGGAHNLDLMGRLRRNLPATRIETTTVAGLDPDWVEAVAFAWLAMRTMNNQTGNLPSVTGARHKVVLGTIHSP